MAIISEENNIPKYTRIIVIDGKTVGIKEFQVQYSFKRPYIRFETTSGCVFALSPSDAREVIDDIEDGKVVYIKKDSQKLFDTIFHWSGIVNGLEEYEEK